MQQLKRLPLAFCMRAVYEKREILMMKLFRQLHKSSCVKPSLASSNSTLRVVYKRAIRWSLCNGSKDNGALFGRRSKQSALWFFLAPNISILRKNEQGISFLEEFLSSHNLAIREQRCSVMYRPKIPLTFGDSAGIILAI